jgi:tRNA (cmo5U34)-methyltransferase
MGKTIEDMFNENAPKYDEQYAKTKALKDALHLLMKAILCNLPQESRLLCIGAGTGQELLYFAQAFPEWKFTVVEPASAMMTICREKAEKQGIAARCSFHEGYLDTLPGDEQFHAATSVLVSQFIKEKKDRLAFFQEIAARLNRGGILINADLAADFETAKFKKIFGIWTNMLDIPSEKAVKLKEQWEKELAVVPANEVEGIISSAGFGPPILFYQTLFIYAWYALQKD